MKIDPNATAEARQMVFVETAKAFCNHIENARTCEYNEFVLGCFRLVSALLSQAIDLAAVGGTLSMDRVSSDRYNEIVQILKKKFGESEHYKMLFDPYSAEGAPLFGSLSDDLADIWRDLQVGIESLENGSPENAVEDWRFSFAHHWGPHHARHALSPLIALVLKNGWYAPGANQ